MAIRDHSSEMKSPQKQAFVKRLLQSSEAGDVPTWPPYFLSSILPLLPHLPVSHFQQLTSQQVSNAPSGNPTFFPSTFHMLKVASECLTAHALNGDAGEQQFGCHKGAPCTSFCLWQGEEPDE